MFGHFVKQLSSKTSGVFISITKCHPAQCNKKTNLSPFISAVVSKELFIRSGGLLHNHTLRHLPLGFCWRFFLFNSGGETPCSRLSGTVAILHDPNPLQLCPLEGETRPSVWTTPQPGGIIPNSVQNGPCQPFIISKICSAQ